MIREIRQHFHVQWEAKRGRATPGEDNLSSLCKEIGVCAGDGGQAELSMAEPLTCASCNRGAPRAGDLQSCGAPWSFLSPFFCFVEDPGRTRAVGSELLREGTWEPGVRLSLEAGVRGQQPRALCEGPSSSYLPGASLTYHHRM